MVLTLLENTLRHPPSEVLHAQGDHEHVVHLADDRDEVGDALNRAHDVEERKADNRFRMPGTSGCTTARRMILNCLRTCLIELFNFCTDGCFTGSST